MPVTDCLRDRFGPAAHEGRALATVNGERWRGYRSHSRPGQSEVTDDRRLIDQGVRGGLEGRPERRISHLDDDLVRYAHQPRTPWSMRRSEEHTSELQSPDHLVCRLLLEKKN